jgi:hypothetical protein
MFLFFISCYFLGFKQTSADVKKSAYVFIIEFLHLIVGLSKETSIFLYYMEWSRKQIHRGKPSEAVTRGEVDDTKL